MFEIVSLLFSLGEGLGDSDLKGGLRISGMKDLDDMIRIFMVSSVYMGLHMVFYMFNAYSR